jgi:hypothetical protein
MVSQLKSDFSELSMFLNAIYPYASACFVALMSRVQENLPDALPVGFIAHLSNTVTGLLKI